METDGCKYERQKNEKETMDMRGRGGRTRYCLSIMVKGSLLLLGCNKRVENGGRPCCVPPECGL